jgi:site-specific DNA recombinase
MTVLTVALYARQSVNVPQGIATQISLMEAEAKRRGWTVVDRFEDNDTSASKPRGAKSRWFQMLRDAKSGNFTYVLATDLDRLLRGQKDLLDLIESGARVVTLSGDLDLSSADGEFRATMLAAIARFEVVRKSERQKRAAVVRAAQGTPHRGRRPFGYEQDGTTIRESEATWLRWAAEQVIELRTLHSICVRLNSEKVRTTAGNDWGTNQLRKMLSKPRNAGIVVHLGTVQPKTKIQPILTVEQHESILAILEGNRAATKLTPGPKATTNWASGLASCGVCGAPMRPKAVTSKGTRKTYYMCEVKVKRTSPDGLRHTSMAANVLEQAITYHVAHEMAFNRDRFTKIQGTDVSHLYKALNGHRAAVDELMQLVGSGNAKAFQIAPQMKELNSKIEAAEKAISEATAQNVVLEMLTVEAADFEAGDEAASMSDTAEREVWAQIMDGVRDDMQMKSEMTFSRMIPERKQQLTKQLCSFTVTPGGKGAKRVEMTRLHHDVDVLQLP